MPYTVDASCFDADFSELRYLHHITAAISSSHWQSLLRHDSLITDYRFELFSLMAFIGVIILLRHFELLSEAFDIELINSQLSLHSKLMYAWLQFRFGDSYWFLWAAIDTNADFSLILIVPALWFRSAIFVFHKALSYVFYGHNIDAAVLRYIIASHDAMTNVRQISSSYW